MDLPLCGRNYTWYKGDGLSMSHLDTLLLNEEWCLSWLNCMQVAQMRGLSDRCLLLLSVDEENWGPKPSRMLKCWQDFPGYKQFVVNQWKTFIIVGWGGFILNEVLKLIKAALKEWHISHTHYLINKVDTLKVRLSELDNKGADVVLSDVEIEEMHGI